MTRWLTRFTPLLAATIGLVTVAACGSHDAPQHAAPAPLPTAEVAIRKVEVTNDGGNIQAIGRVKNIRESTIAAKVMGTVANVRVKSGDKVKAGQVLLKIDDRDAAARVEQARGALAQAEAARTIARATLDRFEKLKEADSAAEVKIEKAVFDHQTALGAVEQASGALRTAETYLRETTVTAPFEGTVVDTLIEQGEMAAPGMPLVRIEGGTALEFEATVNAQDASALAVGQPATVTLDASRDETRDVVGTVAELVPSLDSVTHTTIVRIKLDSAEGLRSGMFGRVRFAVGVKSCPSIYVPASLVVRHGQLAALYLLDENDTVRLRLVKEGESRAEEVEILSGLSAGDRLIVSNIAGLIDGQPAKVVQ